MTVQEIEHTDRRRSAIHECGHIIVARHYGLQASATIWRHYPDNPIEERFWCGSTRYQRPLTSRHSRRIAIAGVVAELMDGLYDEEWELEEALANSYYCDPWSASDFEGAQGWTGKDFHAVYMILRRNWSRLNKEAESLIAEAA